MEGSTSKKKRRRLQQLLTILLTTIISPVCIAFANNAKTPATIRPFRKEDAPAIAQLFHDTVRTVNLGDYSLLQVQAWAPENVEFRNWAEVCQGRFTLVAEVEGGTIAGFEELEENGHIDCFYCHRDYQRKGIGRLLYDAIEREARLQKHKHLLVEASITAKPFFERMGFLALKNQTVFCRGQSFLNWQMQKELNP